MKLSSHELIFVFLCLSLLLFVAKALGEFAKRFGQPAVIGELIAGILLGPTLLGAVAPEVSGRLFPQGTAGAVFLNGFTQFSVVVFLLFAGLEAPLSAARRRGPTALAVSLAGLLIPFVIGFAAARLGPTQLGWRDGSDPFVFELFFATALSISALPVIAKTLLDLGIYRSEVGAVTMSAAIIDDLLGWMVFALILGAAGVSHEAVSPFLIVLEILAFVFFMLAVVRPGVNLLFGWMKPRLSWPSAVIWVSVGLALLAASLTEWLGVHPLFGAFMVGVAVGDSKHVTERELEPLSQFTMSVLAPIFFATVGLRVDFARNFDLGLAGLVFVVACVGKILGCGLAAKWGGMPWRQAWSVGFAMNARGAMEIILGIVALEAGLIDERLFVALVMMAILTSILSGPAIRFLLKPGKSGEVA